MARQKRISKTMDSAAVRAAALSSISATLDLGNGLTLTAYKTDITALQTQLDAYNAKLAELDGLTNDVLTAEKTLNAHSVRMLAAVAVKYGKDSSEYEKAGGTRASERKKTVRKVKTPVK